MRLVLLELTGCHTGILVHQQEGRPTRELVVRHKHNLNAIYHTDAPGLQHFLRRIAVSHEAGVLHQEICIVIGAESEAIVDWHVSVRHMLDTVEEH